MTEKNTVPNLEAKALDGNAKFTTKQWLERFRQFAKREHKIDIAPLLKGQKTLPNSPEKNNSSRKILSGEWDAKHCTR